MIQSQMQVLTTLREAFEWRGTKWWQNTKSNRNEKLPVQPHEMETHVVLAQSWVCLGQKSLPNGFGKE